jgi:hypothetical protein
MIRHGLTSPTSPSRMLNAAARSINVCNTLIRVSKREHRQLISETKTYGGVCRVSLSARKERTINTRD